MTEVEPPRQPGVHRRPPRGSRLVVLLVSLAFIAVAAGLVTFALHKRGEPAKDTSAEQPTSPHASAGSHPPLTPKAAAPAPSTASAASAASTEPPTSTEPPASTEPPTPSSATTPRIADVATLPALDVLNDSRITGLAHRASAQLQASGWTVVTVGNFKGSPDVPATTIFYPDGDEAAAHKLADAFGVARVLKAPSDLSNTNLTVVLARDWPDPPAG